ncbi:uncharacterized protein K460DRAFT_416625 [Cucurbitaria berberidis CBS 394.84]|uniref:Uncharacterized protein n=1 Tax=Cucurbitaria berberidis CBS 394.84 TaxID=1168544 RepID=A0A9P4GHL1_9PLEO|nr:uncharacterized protein K460DRAFT_416625 [Cucurbitaria berberidis CBS 394.84]KAF1845351.1 hypothetical protein K460DRAFT_416625 [Cucurbitaria berberidis CBS 394.84]
MRGIGNSDLVSNQSIGRLLGVFNMRFTAALCYRKPCISTRISTQSRTAEVKRISGLSELDWKKFWSTICGEWKPVDRKEYALLGVNGRGDMLDRINAALAKKRVRRVDYDVGEWAIHRCQTVSIQVFSLSEAKREWAEKFTEEHPVDFESGLEKIMVTITSVDQSIATGGRCRVPAIPEPELQTICEQTKIFCIREKMPAANEWPLLYCIKRTLYKARRLAKNKPTDVVAQQK